MKSIKSPLAKQILKDRKKSIELQRLLLGLKEGETKEFEFNGQTYSINVAKELTII